MFFKFGHRGFRGSASFTENTIGALREALARGAEGLEFDVRLSKDGVLVLMHDATVDRTMNGSGHVAEMNLSELKSLKSRVGVDTIPTLEEVIDTFAGQCVLGIEMVDRGIAPLVKDLLRKKKITDRVIISAFDSDDNDDFNYPNHLSSWAELAEMRPEYPIALLAAKTKIDAMGGEDAYIDAAVNMGAVAIHPDNIAVTASMVQKAHSRSLKVNVYSSNLNDDAEAERLRQMGVDGMFYDAP